MSKPKDKPNPLLPLWAAVLCAAGAGLLLDLAFPDAGVWPLAFPAVGLLLVALIGRRIGGALLVGAVFGAVFYLLLVSWAARYLGVIPWIALAGAETVLTSVAVIPITLAYRWLPRALPGTLARLIALPALVSGLWVARELFLGTWPYGGFPWARLGMSQSESPLATVSSWLGVSGLSFLMVFVVATLIEVVRLRRLWSRWSLVPVAVTVVMVLVPAFPTTTVGTMNIAAVQGNGPTGYFDSREPFEVTNAQTDATEPLYGEDVDLLVWPEGGLDGDPFQYDQIARRLSLVSTRIDAPVLANVATQRGDDFYNTSFLWDSHGWMGQLHDKGHPVPFGEYVPHREFYHALVPDLIGLIQREYTPGTNLPVMQVGDSTIGLAICFDVIYDDVLRSAISHDAQVLVYQTNNADFRDTDENVQQLAFARMRAIEAGRWVVNISTVGTSQVIRPDGVAVSTLPEAEAGALLEEVELRTGATAGIVLGPWVEGLLLWGSLLVLVASRLLPRHRAAAEE